MSEIDIIGLVPLRLLFVTAFAVIPAINTIYDEGFENIDTQQWLAFAVIFIGAGSLWAVSYTVGRSRFNIWPSLIVMTIGFLWYLKLMRDRNELHEEPEMGGTSYE